jgi:hypothetical protein
MNYAEWKKSVPREIQDDALWNQGLTDDTASQSDSFELAELLGNIPLPEP